MSVVKALRETSFVRTARDVIAVGRRAQVSILAAGLAYFGFASLLPFVLLLVILITAVGGEPLAERVLESAASVLGPDHARTVTETVFAEEARLPSILIGAVVLFWSSFRVFRSFDRAFAAVYGAHAERSIAESIRNAGIVMATTFLALVLLGVFGVLYGLQLGLLSSIAPAVLFAALAVLFLPMFYVFPAADVAVVDILPGTILAAGGWAIASILLGVYARLAGGEVYGAAGLVLLILSWLYLGALFVLVGAALNAVLAGHVDPDERWVPPEFE